MSQIQVLHHVSDLQVQVLADSELSSLYNEKLAIRLSDSESEAVTTGTTRLVVVVL